MNKLEVFRQEASIGALVTLRLTRGEDVSGRITQLDGTRISLDLDGKTVTFFADILAGWELHHEAQRAPSPSAHDGNDAVEESGGTATGRHAPTQDAGSAAVESALARVEAKFSEALKRARLQPPEPDFRFPEDAFPSQHVDDIRRDWNRAQNRFQYALKINEPSRLNDVVTQILAPLAETYEDSAETRFLMGCVLLTLNRHAEAMEHLATAAALSAAPKHWLALASAARGDAVTECYSLRRYFRRTSPLSADDAWFRYLAVANPIDLAGVGQIINRWSADKTTLDSGLAHLLSETLIHLLMSAGFASLAQQAAACFVRGDEGLPDGWQDALDRSTGPSEELRAVERRFLRLSRIAPPMQPFRPGDNSPGRAGISATPEQVQDLQRQFKERPVRPDGRDSLRRGRIQSFGNQRFGFIREHGGDTFFFFRIDDVADKALQDALLDGHWRMADKVEFEIHPSPGRKYDRATNIVTTSSDSLLQQARVHLDAGQHAQAMAFVRRVLRAHSTDNTALQLEKEIRKIIRKQLRDHGTGLPKGVGPYARARRAQLVDQDPEEAEKLLKQAIRENDKKGSAIKDLASLLQQYGRTHEAISLLTDHAIQFRHEVAYDNTLATLYQHADRHDDAIKVLTRLVERSATRRKPPLLRRLAFSHFKSARYDESEHALQALLAIDPYDRTATRWLAGLEDARNSTSDAEAEEIIGGLGGLDDEGLELSSLAYAAIERCTYEGVDPRKLQAGTANDTEVSRVVRLAQELGTRRPRDRAGYYLSAAALRKRDSRDDQSGRVYDYLRRYFASMADASLIEKRPAEVVRAYYIESLGLVSEKDNLDEAWRSLFRYLVTFSQGPLDEVGASFPRGRSPDRQEYTDAIQRALEMIASLAEEGWMEGLRTVGSQSSFARIAIGHAVQASQSLRSRFGVSQNSTVQEGWQSQCREYARNYRRRLTACRTMTNYQASVASMEDLRDQLGGFFDSTSSKVDRRRLTSLIEIVDPALAFCRASDFEEKERNYWLVVSLADSFRKDVIDSPTQYSHEGLLPIADHLKSLIEEEYAAMAQTSGAELSLRLLVAQYVRGENSELRIQIEVSNKPGCSPASSVRIRLGPERSEYFVADHQEMEAVSTLRGGTTEVTQMVVRPLDAAVQDRAFPIKATAIYQNSLGETVHTAEYSFTVRLYPDEDFQHLDNPYAPFAEGGPVTEPDMFVGRDDLLSRLERSLIAGSASKSIVMFGQKRAGKSSLLEHLRRRLARNGGVVSVCFSLQDIASELSVAAFLHRILQSASDQLEELRFDGLEVPKYSPPVIDEMESHPTTRFHSEMSSLVRDMRRHSPPLHLVFLVDEFTDVFKEVRRGHIPPQFMKAWKSIIEKKYFTSVLVGQDIMPAFKSEFPNEFGVTEDIRVTYLDDAAAAALVERPIGKKRFAGRAVRCLLDLTAGSPYYTMMFCARLVDYMNATRSMIVTEADIRTVEQEMLQGERRLTEDKFDNLLSAGDGIEDSGIDPEDSYAVCNAIACGSGKETWCSRQVVRGFEDADIDRLLRDLETRDVVERKGDTYRLRVGLFKDWLLARQC